MHISVYCPSRVGHARQLAERLTALTASRVSWLNDPEEIRETAAELLYLAEIKDAGRLADRLHRLAVRVVIQVPHALPHHCSPSRLSAITRLYARADLLLVPHHSIAKDLLELGVDGRKIVELSSYPYRPVRHRIESGRNNQLLLALGYHHSATGVDRLIEMAKLLRQYVGLEMQVIGKIERTEALRLRLHGCKVVSRFVSEQALQRMLPHSACLLLPYRKSCDSPWLNRAVEAGVPVLRTPQVRDWNGSSDATPGLSLPWDVDQWYEAARYFASEATGIKKVATRIAQSDRDRVKQQMQHILQMDGHGCDHESSAISTKTGVE